MMAAKQWMGKAPFRMRRTTLKSNWNRFQWKHTFHVLSPPWQMFANSWISESNASRKKFKHWRAAVRERVSVWEGEVVLLRQVWRVHIFRQFFSTFPLLHGKHVGWQWTLVNKLRNKPPNTSKVKTQTKQLHGDLAILVSLTPWGHQGYPFLDFFSSSTYT
jgi:hypothetical protein